MSGEDIFFCVHSSRNKLECSSSNYFKIEGPFKENNSFLLYEDKLEKTLIKGLTSRICPDCGGRVIYNLRASSYVCEDCGLVFSQSEIDFNQRYFGRFEEGIKKKSSAEAYSPIWSPRTSLRTIINIKETNNPSIKRMIKYQKISDAKARTFLNGRREIMRIGNKLNLANYIREYALKLFIYAQDKGFLKRRGIRATMAACALYSCNIVSCPVPFNNFLKISNLSEHQLNKIYSGLIRALKLPYPIRDPASLVLYYCNKLGINDPQIYLRIIELVKKYYKKPASKGVMPSGVIGGAIYLILKISDFKLSQKDISEIIGITEPTLRERIRELRILI